MSSNRRDIAQTDIQDTQIAPSTLETQLRGLRTSAPVFLHLLGVAQMGLCYLNANLQYRYINSWLADINGLSVEGHFGRSVRDLFPELATIIEPQLQRVIDTGSPVIAGEACLENPTQPEATRHFEHNYFPDKLPNGSVVGISCFVTDVTKRVRAEKALKARAEQFRLLSLSTTDCFWNWDMIAETVERSSGFERIFGYPDQEINADIDWWMERLHPEDKKRVLDVFEAAVAGGQPRCRYEYRFRCRDGSYTIVDDYVCLIRDNADKVVRSLGAMRDVTSIKQAEEKIIQAKKMEAMGTLAARVAHEINNPLAGIKNAFHLIKRAVPRDHKHFEYVGLIQKEIDRIGAIVRQMYGLYGPDAERQRPIEIEILIGDVIALLEFDASERGVRIEKSGCDCHPVHASHAQLTQVMYNLVINAVEASPEGGRVDIVTECDGEKMTIEVRDEGTGVPEDLRSRIFEPFFTTKSEDDKPGLGLGLSESRSLVEGMGGRMELSRGASGGFSGGAVFRVILHCVEVNREDGND